MNFFGGQFLMSAIRIFYCCILVESGLIFSNDITLQSSQ